MNNRNSAAALGRRFPGRRAFVTGAASGLGSELARALHADGWQLGLADLSGSRLAGFTDSLHQQGAAPRTYVGDVADERFIPAAVDDFVIARGGLDVMINNAGVAVAGAIESTPVSDWRWIIDINLLGVIWGCRSAIPVMREQRSGLILNIASSAGFAAAPQMAAYNVTKAGVISLSETMASELHGSGVQVAVAMPGFFRTGLLEKMRAPAAEAETAMALMNGSGHDAAEAADALLKAAAGGSLYIVWPREYRLFWWLKRFWPMTFLRLVRTLGARHFRPADRPPG
jgi:NAD(P)-dependent dehydrogenase (short-subunit alcohol dehydrogenase family)